ncbi:hypothetical protein [Xanthomonas phage RTH11]|nr:hypothetical protein [Xanthomonas phage RTH11]
MTAVCYDGEVIAADRMSRLTAKDGTKQVKSMTQEKIAIDFSSVTFDGDPIRAVGRAGVLKVSLELLRMLRESADLYQQIDEIPDRLRAALGENHRNASLLILTLKHSYILKVDRHGTCRVSKHPRSKKLAIGSGCSIALFLMEQTGLNAVDAVAAMELAHDCCGGGVTYTSRLIAGFDEPLRVREHSDKGVVSQRMLRSLISASATKLSGASA